jgi:hypothetical protein
VGEGFMRHVFFGGLILGVSIMLTGYANADGL